MAAFHQHTLGARRQVVALPVLLLGVRGLTRAAGLGHQGSGSLQDQLSNGRTDKMQLGCGARNPGHWLAVMA
jgi:hypothetical protein